MITFSHGLNLEVQCTFVDLRSHVHVSIDAVEMLGTGRVFRMGRLCNRLQRVCRVDSTHLSMGLLRLRTTCLSVLHQCGSTIDKHALHIARQMAMWLQGHHFNEKYRWHVE